MDTVSEISGLDEIANLIAVKMRPRFDKMGDTIHQLQLENKSLIQSLDREKEWSGAIIDGERFEKKLLQERVAELVPRPPEHQHDPDEPRPVFTFDLDGTLKPQVAQGDGGNYPIQEAPFPKVKKWLDKWFARGACLHIATAGLYYGSREDLEVYNARKEQIEGWIHANGLPFSLIIGKVPSDIYYDDRMFHVPGKPARIQKFIPDWDEIGENAEEAIAKRFVLKNGLWERKEKKRVGKEIEEWPDIKDYAKDRPRGYSGPRIDVDMHRTLSLASSSLREAAPRPGALESIQKLYDLGITIRISCAGWNPKTHSLADSQRRLAGIRRWLLEYGIPYDRIVTKDHADIYFDDKGLQFSSWEADLPAILSRLPQQEAYRHGD